MLAPAEQSVGTLGFSSVSGGLFIWAQQAAHLSGLSVCGPRCCHHLLYV